MRIGKLLIAAAAALPLSISLFTPAPAAEGMARKPAASADTRPTPRLADGKPNLGPEVSGIGFWDRGLGPAVGGARFPPPEEIPFQPWARALYDYRQSRTFVDDPHVRCTPPGGPRQFAVPFGLQIIQVPAIQRIFVLSGGAMRPWRVIYMDGREHPDPEVFNPSFFGHSVGHWEGDTLVVDTVGFNEQFWLHRDGYPHTHALHLIERISRPNYMSLNYEITIDDPLAYTRPWTTSWVKEWDEDEEIIEYFCNENNRDQFVLQPELAPGGK
ncbi:MAG: hypothetical protein LBE59_07070 [Nevskiaceae bacterium]|nr:hypothetical protein [Nevskiaceae bacterium]